MRTTKATAAAILLAVPAALAAAGNFGSLAGQVLLAPASPRAAALGEAMAADTGAVEGFCYNPANLAAVRYMSYFASFTPVVSGVNLAAAGGAYRAGKPGTVGLAIYMVGLFFGALLAGSLILPSRRWPPNTASRRVGLGLVCVWIAGIQPIHPYQYALMVLGFVFLARGFFDPPPRVAEGGEPERESLLDRERGSGQSRAEGVR